MKFFNIEVKIDPKEVANLIHDEQQWVAIDILRRLRKTYAEYDIFRNSEVVREICIAYDIQLNRIQWS